MHAEKSFTVHLNTLLVFEYIRMLTSEYPTNQVFVSEYMYVLWSKFDNVTICRIFVKFISLVYLTWQVNLLRICFSLVSTYVH